MNEMILDIPRLFTGIAEWMACMLYAVQLRPRHKPLKFWSISIVFLIVQCLFLVLTDNVSLYLWIPCMAAAVGLMLTLLLVLCDVGLRGGAYTCIRAFILAEFAAALEWQIRCFLWTGAAPSRGRSVALMLTVYCVVFVVMAFLERQCVPNRQELQVSPMELTMTAVTGVTIFAVSNLSFYTKHTLFSSQYASEIMNIRTLVDLCGVAILFALHIQRAQAQSAREVDALQTILENQYAQYRMSRESIELVNRKYHDLKHQIAALRAEQDPEVREQWLSAMEEDIRSYEAQNKTGNSVLDTVLTGKSLYCQKHGITLSVVADGASLTGMDAMDICTIFGNALDNAIECELKIPDKSKRMIHLNLTTQKQFLMLRLENYCPEPPKFRSGIPQSSKQDTANHGFGVKSIRLTAEKYGGTVTMDMEGEWFVLKLLIPLTRM